MIKYESPTQSFGKPTPSQIEGITNRTKLRWARAAYRQRIAAFVAPLDGSLEHKRLMVYRAMETQTLPPGQLPSKGTIATLEKAWKAGRRSVEDYFDNYQGRTPEFLPEVFERKIQHVIRSGNGKSAHQLTVEFREMAGELGLEAPSYYMVSRRFAKAGKLRRAAARHGSRAAIVDGVPHGRVPARHTHDVWALDELDFPVFIGVWSKRNERWESSIASLVLVVDLRSTAIVSWHLCDPARRLNADGDLPDGGFDTADVLGALLSAACPELAPESTRAFAGYLPRRLRWDNASPHKAIGEMLKNAGIAIDARRIQKRQAFSNGGAEVRVRVSKRWTAGLRGHVSTHAPTDLLTKSTADQARLRTVLAAYTTGRTTQKISIHPEQLPRIEEARMFIDDIITRYNRVHVSSLFRRTPFDQYHAELARDTPRRGRDLVRVLSPQSTVVTNGGIRHYANSREYRYVPVVENTLWLNDRAVTYVADPLNRGIFVEDHHRLHFLAHEPEPDEILAAQMARTRAALARVFSDSAKAHQAADFIEAMGKEAYLRSIESFERAKQALKDAGAEEPHLDYEAEAPIVERPASAVQDEVKPAAADPWSNADLSAFVRTLEEQEGRDA
jgi:hypothetical protein